MTSTKGQFLTLWVLWPPQCLALIGCWVAGSYDFEDRRPVPHSLSKDIMAEPGAGSVSNKTARVVTGREGGAHVPRPGCVERGAGLVYRLRLSSRDTASRSTSSVKHVWCVALQLRQPLERRSRCGTLRTGQRRRHGIYGTSLAVTRGLVLCATAN